MLIEINRRVLEQVIKDRASMYKLVNNWLIETHEHYNWWGIGLHRDHKHLSFRHRGATQISIIYEDRGVNYWTDLGHIEKRIVKYKKL